MNASSKSIDIASAKCLLVLEGSALNIGAISKYMLLQI